MESVELYIEALIFSSEQSIRTEEITYCLQSVFDRDFSGDEINPAITAIQKKYADDTFAIELVKLNNGYQFLTKKICRRTNCYGARQYARKKRRPQTFTLTHFM